MPPSQDEFVTTKLNVTYNPNAQEKLNAKKQTIQEFFKDICSDDYELLQEWSGYHLIQDMPHHKIAWLFGPKGRNGKGTWARLHQGVLGYENFGNLTAEDLTGKNEFAIANLEGKLGNISPEPDSSVPLTTETLNSLSGADYIDTKIKYVQAPRKIRNIAKITMFGNQYPVFKNPTAAIFKRLLIIVFPNSYEQSEVANIEQIWIDDEDSKSAYLNWLIIGLQRLLNNGKFTDNLAWKEKQQIFTISQDPLTAFVEKNIIFDSDAKIAKSILQAELDKFCKNKKVPPIDIKKKALQTIAQTKYSYLISDQNIRMKTEDEIKSKTVWHWIGIRLKTLLEKTQDTEESKEDNDSPNVSDDFPKNPEHLNTRTEHTTVFKCSNVQEKNKSPLASSQPVPKDQAAGNLQPKIIDGVTYDSYNDTDKTEPKPLLIPLNCKSCPYYNNISCPHKHTNPDDDNYGDSNWFNDCPRRLGGN